MQHWLSAMGSAPTWFTPNFKLKWLKPNPNPSLFVGTSFKFQVFMFIFPKIRAAALFWSWEYPPAVPVAPGAEIPCGMGGKVEGDASPLVPQVLGEFLSGLISSIPTDARLGWGWEAPGPARRFGGLWGKREGEGRKPVGKAPILEGKLQNWRKSTKPNPRRDFSMGMGMGRLRCDPKVKLSALTYVVGIQIAAIRSCWRKTLSFSVCKTR